MSKVSRNILNSWGKRATRQRTLLLDLIRRSKGHVDADELYRIARKKDPRLSLATVYRNLQLFKKLGVVEERHFDEAHHHYEATGSLQHHHLVCFGCGQVTEFRFSGTPQMIEEAAQRQNFEVTGGEVVLMGYCAQCQAKRTQS